MTARRLSRAWWRRLPGSAPTVRPVDGGRVENDGCQKGGGLRRRLTTAAAVVLALCLLAGGTLQLLPLPNGGPSQAGAAVTPLPTPTVPNGGRVSNDGTAGLPEGGFHSDIEMKGGCESWGTNYVGTAYIHEAVSGGTIYGAWSVTASGGVTAEKTGVAPFYGSLQGITQCPNDPVMGIAATPDSKGYWIATSGGGVFAGFGDAPFDGSRGTGGFTGPMVAVVADPAGSGYWLIDHFGQVYSYGAAGYHGGTPPNIRTKYAFDGDEVEAAGATPTGGGYWMVTNYGTVFAYGNASIADFDDPGLGGTNANWYSGVGGGPGASGFWLVRDKGQTYAFDETYYGNPTLGTPNQKVVALTDSTNEGGYLLTNSSGQYYAYGDAVHPTNPPYVPPPPPPPPPPPAGSETEQVAGGGNTATNYTEPCSGDPVNCESGDFWETDTDATVPGLGQHLDLARTYNSTSASTLGTFGHGWSDTYAMSVSAIPNTSATVTEADGSTVTFWTNTTAIFVAPTGTLATLSRKPTGGYAFVVRNTTTYTFNADGRLVAEKDLNDYTTTLAYNGAGQLTTVTDPTGRTLTFAYNATGLVSSATNPAGQATAYGYTTKNLTSVTDPAGRVTRYTYDATHRLLTETSPTGGVTTNTYGTRGKVVRQVDPTGLATTWTYAGTNAASGTTTITGPEGSVTKETFSDGQMAAKTTGYGTPSAATWHYTYTPTTFGETSVTDPDGNTATTTYNAAGDVASVTDATGNTTATTYNAYNEPLVTVDPMGITTTDTYDTHGNLTKTVVKADSSCSSSCTEVTTDTYGNPTRPGEVTKTTDPVGNQTSYTYDPYGDVATTSVEGTGTLTTQALYNVLGEKVCEVQPDKYGPGTRCPAVGDPRVAGTTTWTYDPDGEVVAATNALTQTTTTAYDVHYGTAPCTAVIGAAAYCTVTTAPVTDTTVTYDDHDGRQVGTVTAEGTATQSTSGTAYDVAPGSGSCATGVTTATNCAITTNGTGQSITTYLNAVTEAIKVVAPGNQVTTSTYDKTGNLATKTTAAGTATDGYDKDNRLTSVTYSGTASGYTKPANVTYTYNADGQRTKMVDGSGTTTDTYDGFDRLTSTNDGAGKVVSYAYNADGEATTVTYPTRGVAHRTFNGAGQMTSTTGPGIGQITFSRSNDGSDMETRFPNHDQETTSYNALGQQVTAKMAPSGTAAPIWSATPTPLDKTPAKMVCPSTSFCAAITSTGTNPSILTSSNPQGGSGTWTVTTLTYEGQLNAISCPSTSLCVAVGTTGAVVTSTDPAGGTSTWTAVSVAGVGRVMGISCPTTTFCVAVTRKGDILTSSDPTGGASAWTTTAITGGEKFTAVACPTLTVCLAGSETGGIYISHDPGGGASAWRRIIVDQGVPVTAIGCSSAQLCVAATRGEGTTTAKRTRVFIGRHLETGSTGTWRGAKLGDTAVHGLSCAPTTTFCALVAGGGQVWTTTDPTDISGGSGEFSDLAFWTLHNLGSTETVSGIACMTSAHCLAGETKYTTSLGYTLAQVVTMTAGTRSFDVADTYGTNDLVANATETGPDSTLIDHSTYGYDTEGQIVSATVTGQNAGAYAYAYDAAGDPTSLTVPGEGANTTQAFADNGELTTASPSLGSPTTFGYNGVGDRTAQTAGGQATTYSYNQAGELTKISGRPTGFTGFTYNGDGLRTSEAVPTGVVGTWTQETGTVSTTLRIARRMSCSSDTFCAYVTQTGYVFTSADPTGGGGKWSGTDIDGSRVLIGISCPSATFCAAVDETGNVLTSTDPSGGAGDWKSTNVSSYSLGISCPTRNFCLMTTASGIAYSINPGSGTDTWTAVNLGINHMMTVSCPSVDLCVAATITGGKIVSSDHPTGTAATWNITTVDYRSGTEVWGAVDCPSTSLCVAVNSQGVVMSSTDPTGGKQAWRLTSVNGIGQNSAPSISCPSTTECVIHTGSTIVSSNPTGTATTWKVEDVGGSLDAMACPSEFLCIGSSGKNVYKATTGETTNQFTWGTVDGSTELLSDGTDNFVYGPTGEVVAQVGTTSSQQATYLIHDALGSTVATVNSTQLVSTYAYSPYGATIEHSGPSSTPIGFAGSYTDKMTGLLYMEHRFYTPQTGEFLSVDPMVTTTHEPYEYATDDPVNTTDPTGLCTLGICAITDIGHAVKKAAKTVAHAVATHKKTIEIGAGVALGVAAAATGVGAIVEGSALLAAGSVVLGAAGSALDYGPCRSGNTAACMGLALDATGAAAGAAGAVAALAGAEGAAALLGGFALNVGVGGLVMDAGSGFFGAGGGGSGPAGSRGSIAGAGAYGSC